MAFDNLSDYIVADTSRSSDAPPLTKLADNDFIGSQNGLKALDAFKTDLFTCSDMSRQGLKDQSKETITGAFAELSAEVHGLELAHNSIFDKAGTSLLGIFSALPPTLIYLGLGNNNLYYSLQADPSRYHDLQDDLKQLPKFEALNLENNGLGSFGDRLAPLLAAFPRVRGIHLGHNALHKLSGKALGDSLKALNGIETIILTKNNLSLLSPEALAEAFSQLPDSVTTLDLSDNNLDDNALDAILPAIKKSKLLAIDLGDNPSISPGKKRELSTILNQHQPRAKAAVSDAATGSSPDAKARYGRSRMKALFDFFKPSGSDDLAKAHSSKKQSPMK